MFILETLKQIEILTSRQTVQITVIALLMYWLVIFIRIYQKNVINNYLLFYIKWYNKIGTLIILYKTK